MRQPFSAGPLITYENCTKAALGLRQSRCAVREEMLHECFALLAAAFDADLLGGQVSPWAQKLP